MSAPLLSITRRLRRTPFTDRVTEAGVKAYTVYNHMLLPTVFRSMEEDYWHLREAVQIWDVSCERQVQVRGLDAARLIQTLTPRDVSDLPIGRCAYTPMVDETGGMLNDPVLLKLSEDKYWISIADSDLLLWVKGLAQGLRLDVAVREPDVSPLAVQGPKAEDVVAAVFGERVRDIKFFRFEPMLFNDKEFIVARSGYSKQGGFEIYVEGSENGPMLWDAIMEAGEPYDIHAGGPNLIERVEGGLLSYGNDMTRVNTPHECGLGKFCQTADAIGCVGRDALIRIIMEGPRRQIRGLSISGPSLPGTVDPWPLDVSGKFAGQVTSSAWSPRLKTNVAIGMVEERYWDTGTEVIVATPDGQRAAEVVDLPFPN
jgi:dimethylsulfoniopropionate demethylase